MNGQKIYGFVAAECGWKIFVFGGKQFTVVKSTALEGDALVYTRLFEPVVCDDWIHSAVWTDEDNVALLTAHNVVQVSLRYTFQSYIQHKYDLSRSLQARPVTIVDHTVFYSYQLR